eukprot:Em0002g1384a
MALSRSPVPANLTPKTASYPVFSLLPIGDFGGGDCTIVLTSATLSISSSSPSPDSRTIATWRYSTIRDFSCTSSLFCFTSGRRGPFGLHKYVFKVSASVMPSLLTTLSTITGVDIAPLDTSAEGIHTENWYSANGPPPSSLGNLEDTNSHHCCANANFYTDVVSVSASGGGTPTSSLFQVSPPPTTLHSPSPCQVSPLPPPLPSALARDQSGAANASQATHPRRFWARVPHSYEEIVDPPFTKSAETTSAVENPQRNGNPPLTCEVPSPLSDSPTHQEGARFPVPFPLPPIQQQQQQQLRGLPSPNLSFLAGRYEMLPAFGVTSNPSGGDGFPLPQETSALATNSGTHPGMDHRVMPPVKNADLTVPVAPLATQVGHSSQEVSPTAVTAGGRPTRGWTSPLLGKVTGGDNSNPSSSSSSSAIRATAAAPNEDDLSLPGGNIEEGYEVLTPRSDRRFLLWGAAGGGGRRKAVTAATGAAKKAVRELDPRLQQWVE